MTSTAPTAAISAQERRRAAATVLALVGYVVLLGAGYFRMPPGELTVSGAWSAVLLLSGALVLLLLLYVRGLRRIRTAQAPVLRSLALVVVLVSTFLVVFAYAYLSIETRDPDELSGLVTHMDALYFTVTVLTTVGFGDIAPTGQVARMVVTLQMLISVAVLGVLVRAAITTGRQARASRATGSPAPSGGGP